MRLFEKRERQNLVRVKIKDGKYMCAFTIADSNIREVFDMVERVIGANEVPEVTTLTTVILREIEGTKNGVYKSIKTKYITANKLHSFLINEIKYNNSFNIKPIKDSWSREEVKQLMELAYNEGYSTNGEVIDIDKWIEENL